MTIKYGDGGNLRDGFRGQKLVTTYVHQSNQEFHIQSADFSTGTLTLKEPHGLVANTVVLICPNYSGLDNPTRDLLSIPMEWIKPQGVASPTANTGLGFKVIDSVTVQVVRSSDFTTALPVNLTITENNNNVDITKFHFEVPVSWTIDNLPLLKRFLMRTRGFVKHIDKTGGTYRYKNIKVAYEDGTKGLMMSPQGTNQYLSLLGLPNITNSNAAAGTYVFSDYFIDATSQQVVFDFVNWHYGRRAGYNNLVWDGVMEANGGNRKLYSCGKPIIGVTGIESLSVFYAHMANGTVIEIWDLGVS